MTLTRTGTIHQGRLVFREPLPLPEGAEVTVTITPAATERAAQEQDEAREFASLPAFGMWADREDMQDSVAWVNQERARWRQRASRRD